MNVTNDEVLENNNVDVPDVKSNKKKIKPIIVVIISMLLCALFGVGGWFLGTKFADKEDNIDIVVDENKEDKDKNEVEDNTKEEADDIEQDTVDDEKVDSEDDKAEFVPDETSVSTSIEEFEIALYDSKTILKSDYEITKRKVLADEEKEIYVYALYRKVSLNDKVVAEKHMLGIYDSLNEAKEDIDTFSIKEYKTIKDSKNDDTYLVIQVYMDNPIHDNYITYWNSNYELTYILNSKGEELAEIKSKYAGTTIIGVYVTEEDIKDRYYIIAEEDDVMFDSLSKDHKYVLYPQNRIIDLHDKYLYYFTYQDGSDCSSTEHKIVIENGKLIDSVVKVFDFNLVSGAGATC